MIKKLSREQKAILSIELSYLTLLVTSLCL